jgi:dienelactone hydrolase
VRTPDLYEGRTFDTLDEGIGHAEQIGFGEVIERGVRAVEGLPTELVYAGFSLGVLPAQKLAQTRPSARGALLFYSCVPVAEFGSAWPDGVPVQIHGMDADPIFVGEGDIALRGPSSSRPVGPSCSSIPATSIILPTARCRPTTPRPPRCCSTARWCFSAPGDVSRMPVAVEVTMDCGRDCDQARMETMETD